MSNSLKVLEIPFDEQPMKAAKNYAKNHVNFSGIIEVVKYKTYQAKKSKTYYYEVSNGTVSRTTKPIVRSNWKARYSAEILQESKALALELLGL
ncbi:MAG: hypothetical protein ACFFDT_00250 [Candidatus Hodarchaeota archaeon]